MEIGIKGGGDMPAENNTAVIIEGDTLVHYEGSDREFVIPDGVRVIGERAFADNMKLASITVPPSVVVIENEAFAECRALNEIHLPNTVDKIGDRAFMRCQSLISIELPMSVSDFGEGVFAYCTRLLRVELPVNIKELKSLTFEMCTCLEEIEVPDRIKLIGEGAFRGCTALSKVALSIKLEKIGKEAFKDCVSLTVIQLPHSLGFMGYDSQGAFEGCENLEMITIGDDTYFDPDCGVFVNCPKLLDIRYSHLNEDDVIRVFPAYLKKLRDRQIEWQAHKKCTYCGGDFSGVIKKVCKNCGKQKAY
ncbi:MULTISPECIES: leucine-rich repeat domain-containing protein [unclassified Ruminococcus]|uniref:leucine-rich repeat domain-containing protein n=1 Tax=unclassified Ruminococcus TaxID=2608920 RepID=UPI0009FDC022|nr:MULTISPECIES: leucine-rich repeat domain-containing protein [unclassified Ruminococcus]